jgi:DNA (cytosine-5)-methyltransferase 1
MAIDAAAPQIQGVPGHAARVRRSPIARYADLRRSAATDHRKWRMRFASLLVAAPVSRFEATRAVAALASDLLTITGLLDREYSSPDLGNKVDPVDELVYIILSRRTREGAYQAAFARLRAKYKTWESLAAASEEEIVTVIDFSGLGRRKAQSLKLALGVLIDRFGECTLEPTRAWQDDEIRDFLCALPEIGPKSAACVMMCSLDRPAFPVDAHVGRVLERLDIFRRVGIDLRGRDHKVKQRVLWDAVPPTLRYPLHVNLLVHGRNVCLPRRPRCESCVIASFCDFAARRDHAEREASSRSTD